MSDSNKPLNKIKDLIKRKKNKWEVPDLSSENYQDKKRKDTIVEYLQNKSARHRSVPKETNKPDNKINSQKKSKKPEQKSNRKITSNMLNSNIAEKLMGKMPKRREPERPKYTKKEKNEDTKKVQNSFVTSMGSYLEEKEVNSILSQNGTTNPTSKIVHNLENFHKPGSTDQKLFEKNFNTNIDLKEKTEIRDTSRNFHDNDYWDSTKPGVKLGTLSILDLEEGLFEELDRPDVDVPDDLNEEIIDSTSELYNLDKFSNTDEIGIVNNDWEDTSEIKEETLGKTLEMEELENEVMYESKESEMDDESIDNEINSIIEEEEEIDGFQDEESYDDYDSGIEEEEFEEEKTTSVISPDELVDLEDEEEVRPEPERNLFIDYELPSINLLDEILDTKEEEQKERETQHFSECIEKVIEIMNLPMHIEKREMGSRLVKFYCPIDQELFNFSSVSTLKDRLDAMIGSSFIRYEFPLEGHSNTFGIEIPYKEVVTLVQMRRAFGGNVFTDESEICFPIGLDVNGNLPIANLENMVHLLVAGSTGSGKSVFLQSIILTFLLRVNPAKLKLVLIDPKHVEFSKYENIPHLLAPIITDIETAILTLEKLVETMEDRYVKFRSLLVKDIKGYNKKCSPKDIIPYIVMIVDEFADLMMESQDDRLEDAIKRLAQKARAAGIHMIVATQRPDADVITGAIKTNLPTRISFKLPNNTNSRIILEAGGAEKLLGKGDMLLKDPAEEKLQRIQGVFASEDEIDRIVDWVVNQDEPDFFEEFVNIKEKKAKVAASSFVQGNGEKISYDYVKAIDLILSTYEDIKGVSISNIQRKLSVGHSKAGRIVDALADKGLITQDSGKNKPREIVGTKEQFIEIRKQWEEAVLGAEG